MGLPLTPDSMINAQNKSLSCPNTLYGQEASLVNGLTTNKLFFVFKQQKTVFHSFVICCDFGFCVGRHFQFDPVISTPVTQTQTWHGYYNIQIRNILNITLHQSISMLHMLCVWAPRLYLFLMKQFIRRVWHMNRLINLWWRNP